MTSAARLCAALAALAAGVASPAIAVAPTTKGVYAVPAGLGSLCTDTTRLEHELLTRLQPQPKALDQWTSLLRTLTCDLAGKQDLGWRRVPLRSYATVVSYPLTWIEYQTRGDRERRIVRTYRSRNQMPQKLEFWLGGHIDEVQYDARRHILAARFPAARNPLDTGTGCSGTRLSFRQQQGAWFLSGVEPLPHLPCRLG